MSTPYPEGRLQPGEKVQARARGSAARLVLEPWQGSGTSGELIIHYNAPLQGQQVAGRLGNRLSQPDGQPASHPASPTHQNGH